MVSQEWDGLEVVEDLPGRGRGISHRGFSVAGSYSWVAPASRRTSEGAPCGRQSSKMDGCAMRALLIG